MNEVIKNMYGEAEKNVKTAKSVKRSNNKVKNDNSKYMTKIVDGVKYMVLR